MPQINLLLNKTVMKKKCWFQFVEKKHNENVGEMFLIIRKYCNLWITAKKLKQQNAC